MSVSPRGGTEVKVCQQTHDSTVGLGTVQDR